MITKVYGTANSVDVIFSHIDGDLWQAEVPTSKDGIFAVAIYAENDAGNKAYICRLLFAITGHQMKIYIVENGFTSNPEESGYAGDPELEEFASKFEDLLYKSGMAKKLEFVSAIEERGYRSEYILCDRAAS